MNFSLPEPEVGLTTRLAPYRRGQCRYITDSHPYSPAGPLLIEQIEVENLATATGTD